jgi:hypothetical protein
VSKTDRDAALLREAWERAQRTRADKGLPKLSQKALAAQHHVSAGMVSHYYKGTEPLNVKWQLRFAEYLSVSPVTIWHDFPYQTITSHEKETIELVKAIQELDQPAFAALQSLVRSLPKKKA